MPARPKGACIGFAGYFAARRTGRVLDDTDIKVTLLSDSDGMLYSLLLPDVAVRALDPRAISVLTSTTHVPPSPPSMTLPDADRSWLRAEHQTSTPEVALPNLER